MEAVTIWLKREDRDLGVFTIGSIAPMVQSYLFKRGIAFERGNVSSLLALASLIYEGDAREAIEMAFEYLWPTGSELEAVLAKIAAKDIAESWNAVAERLGLPKFAALNGLAVEDSDTEATERLKELLFEIREYLFGELNKLVEVSRESPEALLALAVMRTVVRDANRLLEVTVF